MPAKNRRSAWTVVQHSGYGYGGDKPEFKQGLEVRELGVHEPFDRELGRVLIAGGRVFDSYDAAVAYEHTEPFPPGYDGIIPRAPGRFAAEKIDGLAIYVPDGEIESRYIELGRLVAGWSGTIGDVDLLDELIAALPHSAVPESVGVVADSLGSDPMADDVEDFEYDADHAPPEKPWPLSWRRLYPRERWLWFEQLWSDVLEMRERYRLAVRSGWWENDLQVEALAAFAAAVARYDSGDWDDDPLGKLNMLHDGMRQLGTLLHEKGEPFHPDRDRVAYARFAVEERGCQLPPNYEHERTRKQ